MTHNRKIIYLAGFLFAMPIALAAYINSSFIASFIGEQFSGVIYIIGSIFSVLGLIYGPRIFKNLGGYKFILYATFLDALSFLVLASTNNKIAIILAFIFGFCLNTLISFALDEILKIFSVDGSTGKIRGVYIATTNLAWILAQIGRGSILGSYSFSTIYLVSFFITILFFIVLAFNLYKITEPKYDTIKNLLYIKKFFKNKNLFRAYSLTFLLQIFYCWMVIYTPIYLSAHLGFSWKDIGVIFATMLLPFSFIPFHVGKLSDKVGERKILMFGFFITAFSTISLFFIKDNILLIWAFLLFTTRIGAATVETMSDSYFFKHIKPENEEYIGVYRSASPVAYIIGPMVAMLFFSIVPSFNFIYLILGSLMLFGIYIASTISKKDI